MSARLQGRHTEDFGQVAFTVDAQPGSPRPPYEIHGLSHIQDRFAGECCGRAEWTLDRVTQGFQPLLAGQEQYWMISGGVATYG